MASLNPYGVDLNHHLIPDPVAGAISCLLDRIRILEQAVGSPRLSARWYAAEDECEECEARDVCETDSLQRRGSSCMDLLDFEAQSLYFDDACLKRSHALLDAAAEAYGNAEAEQGYCAHIFSNPNT